MKKKEFKIVIYFLSPKRRLFILNFFFYHTEYSNKNINDVLKYGH